MVHENTVKKDTYNTAISQYLIKGKIMKIYHYTKGISMNSIFTDAFIATEHKRGLSQIHQLTDCVWLTEKTQFPKTALPYLSNMPETNLSLHINKTIYVDLDKLARYTGGIYRFSFNSDEGRFVKWRFSEARKEVENNIQWRRMESIANKVSDDHRSFWISNNDVDLINFSLEEFLGGAWNKILTNCSLNELSNSEISTIDNIKTKSTLTCRSYGLPVHQIREAA